MNNIRKKHKYAFMNIKSSQLRSNLDKYRELYINQSEPEYLALPYVLMCAVFLEARLNDSFHAAEKYYGREFSMSLLALPFGHKLKALVPALTNGKYVINMNDSVYQKLSTLINVRNKIAHPKSKFREIDPSDSSFIDAPIVNMGMARIPAAILRDSDDINNIITDNYPPLEYHQALDRLEKWFFRRCPDGLSKVKMVLKRPRESQWKEVSTIFVMNVE